MQTPDSRAPRPCIADELANRVSGSRRHPPGDATFPPLEILRLDTRVPPPRKAHARLRPVSWLRKAPHSRGRLRACDGSIHPELALHTQALLTTPPTHDGA